MPNLVSPALSEHNYPDFLVESRIIDCKWGNHLRNMIETINAYAEASRRPENHVRVDQVDPLPTLRNILGHLRTLARRCPEDPDRNFYALDGLVREMEVLRQLERDQGEKAIPLQAPA